MLGLTPFSIQFIFISNQIQIFISISHQNTSKINIQKHQENNHIQTQNGGKRQEGQRPEIATP